MKNLKFLIILLVSFIGFSSVNEVKAQEVDISFSTFQRDLGPHGRWINNPKFGQVWVYNQAGFRPYYSDGHWEYTNYGWEWISDFDWGWAPFHYGRWEYDPFDGWMWIPGYEWAPAWVSWSSYDNYYGWAPLGYGNSINISFGSIPYERWTFIPRQNICDRDIRHYYVVPERNYACRNAVVINNYYEGNGREGRFFRGPDRDDVQRYTHNRIEERRIDYRDRPENRVAYNNNNGNRNDNWNRDNRQNNNNQQQDNFQKKEQERHQQAQQPNNFQQKEQERRLQVQQQEQQRQQQDNFQRKEQERRQQVQQQEQQRQPQDNFQRKEQERRQRVQQQEQQRQPQDNSQKRQPQFQGPPIREQRAEPVQQERVDRRQDNNGQGNQRSADYPKHGGGRRGN